MLLRVCVTGFFVLAGCLLTGCGKKEARIVPVSGVVKIDGHPASNIAVRFLPDGQKGFIGPSSTGITDEQGKFTLQCDSGKPGGVVGWHRVTFDDLNVDRPAQGQKQMNLPRFDGKYSLPNQSIEVEVKESSGELTLEIPGIK